MANRLAESVTCEGCGHPLRLVGLGPDAGYVIDLAYDRLDQLRPELWGLPRLDGRTYCPPNAYAINVGPHVPAAPNGGDRG